MTIKDSIGTALTAIVANKLRSVLTTLGVMIGVASVIAMIGIAEGTKRQSLARLEALGSNLIVVFPNWGMRGARQGDAEAQSLKMKDVAMIRQAVPTATAVTGEVRTRVQVKYGRAEHPRHPQHQAQRGQVLHSGRERRRGQSLRPRLRHLRPAVRWRQRDRRDDPAEQSRLHGLRSGNVQGRRRRRPDEHGRHGLGAHPDRVDEDSAERLPELDLSAGGE
jgi:hypothetical protein